MQPQALWARIEPIRVVQVVVVSDKGAHADA